MIKYSTAFRESIIDLLELTFVSVASQDRALYLILDSTNFTSTNSFYNSASNPYALKI